MFEKIKNLRIKFINFKERNKPQNEKVNFQKIKEARSLGYSSCINRNRLYKFF